MFEKIKNWLERCKVEGSMPVEAYKTKFKKEKIEQEVEAEDTGEVLMIIPGLITFIDGPFANLCKAFYCDRNGKTNISLELRELRHEFVVNYPITWPEKILVTDKNDSSTYYLFNCQTHSANYSIKISKDIKVEVIE